MVKSPPTACRLWVAAATLGLAPAAHAYLDPSTGSMILSAAVGIFATIGLAVKTYWYKLKGLFRRSAGSASAASSGGQRRDDSRSPPAGNC